MTELTEEVVETMHKITKAVKEDNIFTINRIEVSKTGDGKPRIEFDIVYGGEE